MRLLLQIKTFFFLIIAGLCICGGLYIKSFFVKTKQAQIQNKVVQNEIVSNSLRDLEKCKTELFDIKNEAERLKIMPDARKDIVKLLLILHDIDKKLGLKTDFSDECVRLFATASRVPIIQDYVVGYKEKMFEGICQVATQDHILALIVPFDIKVLDYQYKQSIKNEKLPSRILDGAKYNLLKFFKKTKIEKSPLEKLVIKRDYSGALNLLENSLDGASYRETEEYNNLHKSLNSLYLLDKLINDLYLLVEKI